MIKIENIFKALLLAALAFLAVVIVIFPKFTIDDSFILMRYADNLAHHGQLTWNVGEKPVEGYTSFLMTLVLAGFIKLGLSPVLMGKAVGVVAFLLSLLCVWLILRKFKVSLAVRTIIFVIFITNPAIYIHALGGMDTMLFNAMILAAALSFLYYLERKSFPREVIFSLVLLLLSLTRPEGLIFSMIFAATLVFIKTKNKQVNFWVIGCCFFLPFLIYFICRSNYYGYLLPNTFYAKDSWSFSKGWFWFKAFFAKCFFYPIGATVALAVLVGIFGRRVRLGHSDAGKNISKLLIPLSIGLLITTIQYLKTSQTMNFYYRYYVPFFSIALITFALCWQHAIDIFVFTGPNRHRAFCWSVAILGTVVFLQVYDNVARFPGAMAFAVVQRYTMEQEGRPVGLLIKQNVPPEEWIAVYVDAGATPYYAERKTLDLGVLNDDFLAHHPRDPRGWADYVFSHDPGAIVVTGKTLRRDDLQSISPYLAQIVNDQRFKKYILTVVFGCELTSNYYQFVFFRDDIFKKIKLKGK